MIVKKTNLAALPHLLNHVRSSVDGKEVET